MTHTLHPSGISDPARFEAALLRFDAENAADPNTDLEGGTPLPRELLYARRLTAWVLRLRPDASEKLRLAARCQHICRWAIPRGDYPPDRPGYLKWRADLKKFHAQKSGEILRETGYGEAMVEEVQALNLKKNFPREEDSRVLEDALCLVFLEFQCDELATRTDDEKMVNALRKSWNKMTGQGRDAALKLPLAPPLPDLIRRAMEEV